MMKQRVTDADIKKRLEKVKTKLAIMSGKGGVGKSTVTALLAVHYAKKGHTVGIFDADFLGPSIPKIFGVEDKRPMLRDGLLEPVYSERYGIRIMSIQFFLPSKDSPVIWRGPMISGVMRDFLGRTDWGELDYLLFDLPPGTGDAPLTILQEIKPNGVIVVTSPQDLTTMIVKKSINMAESLETAVVGIVENMSYYECPQCGHREYLFGKGKASEIASKHRIEFVVEIPIDPNLTKLADSGKIEVYDIDYFEFFPI
jgi:Mrp family chromosome partitioning ATPase